MADVQEALKKGLQELKGEITCPVCQEFFQDPKILPCFHYYCKRCVLQLASREQPFPCPECRGETLLPPTGAGGFPTAFFVNRMKSLHDAMEKAQGATASGLVCDQCQSAEQVVAFCRNCAHYICDYCREGHRRMKVFSGHTVVSIEEVRQNATSNLPVINPEPMTCEEHQEQLKIYCFDCGLLICRDCIIKDHKEHEFEFVKKCALEIKQAIQKSKGPLEQAQGQIKDARKSLEESGKELDAQEAHLEKKINHSFDEVVAVIEQRRRDVLGTVSKKMKEKRLSLSHQDEVLDAHSAQIQGLLDFVDQSIGNASDEEIVSIHKQLQHKMEAETKCCSELDLKPTPSPEIDVEISFVAEVEDFCQKGAVVITLADPSICKTEGPGIEKAEISVPTQLTVHTVYCNGQPCSEKQLIRAEVKSVVDCSVVRAEVRESGRGSYLVSYCPEVRGRHRLDVFVNQQPIAGSPFEVFVEYPPTQLGKPVQVMTGVGKPYAIALDKTGQLFVTQPWHNAISVLTKNSRSVSIEMVEPRGIAIGEDDSILVTSGVTGELMKFTKDWALVQKSGIDFGAGGKVSNIGRVKINPSNQNYYVCDRGNHCIRVFDQDLKYIRSFGSKGNELGCLIDPFDVSFDTDGHVYVVENGNSRVQKFSFNKPVLVFGKHGSGLGELSDPRGIDISGSLVYVTEWSNHRVSVFSTGGKFMCCFGQPDLCSPQGIITDKDGFVYICCYGKDQIIAY